MMLTIKRHQPLVKLRVREVQLQSSFDYSTSAIFVGPDSWGHNDRHYFLNLALRLSTEPIVDRGLFEAKQR